MMSGRASVGAGQPHQPPLPRLVEPVLQARSHRLGQTEAQRDDRRVVDRQQGGTGRVEQNDLTVFGQKNIGREGFVSIGGAVAKATLVPASDLPAFADRWNTRSLTVGGGYGPFSANIIGRVVETPSQPGQWEGLGVGLTWRTPWSGQLTVGAENVVTRGRNPFAQREDGDADGTVPYVRYEQDL